MDLSIRTDLNTLPSVIEFNYEELKAEITLNLEKYRNLVITEDGIKQAKSDKAKLNKLITAIEDERKEVKRRCLEPYNSFETKCKELVSLIKAPVTAIDVQLKEFEDIRKQQKYDELKTCYEAYVGDMSEIIEFEKILNPKWSNATSKTETLKAEIEDNIDRIRQELETLNAEYSDKPYKAAVISEYCKQYSTSQALVRASQLQHEEEVQKRILEKKKSQPKVKEPTENIQPAHPVEESQGTCTFKVICTRNQLVNLREYMKVNGIIFEVIRKKDKEDESK